MERRTLIVLLSACAFLILLVGAAQAQQPPAAPGQAAANPVAELHRILGARGPGAAAGGAQRNTDALLVADDQEFMSVLVPAGWRDTDTGPWMEDGREIGVFVAAAPDLAAFEAEAGPGVFIGLTHAGIPQQPVNDEPTLAVFEAGKRGLARGLAKYGDCPPARPQVYHDVFRSGAYEVVSGCARDQGRAQRVLLELLPLSQNYRLSLRAITFTGPDRAALDQTLRTLQVLNPQMLDLHHEEHHEE